MRISVEEKDKGFWTLTQMRSEGKEPIVKLNGQEVKLVETADDTTGYIRYCLTDDKGNPTFGNIHPDEWDIVEEYGVVTINTRYTKI